MAGPTRMKFHGLNGYLQSLIAGFLLGNLAFLIIVAPATHGTGLDKMPVLLAFAAGGMGLLLFLTVAANFLIGRRTRKGLALQRAIAARRAASPLALPVDYREDWDRSAAGKPKRKRSPHVRPRADEHAEGAVARG